jgi:hypothetical protein
MPTKAATPPSEPRWVHEIKHDGFPVAVVDQVGVTKGCLFKRIRVPIRRGLTKSTTLQHLPNPVPVVRWPLGDPSDSWLDRNASRRSRWAPSGGSSDVRSDRRSGELQEQSGRAADWKRHAKDELSVCYTAVPMSCVEYPYGGILTMMRAIEGSTFGPGLRPQPQEADALLSVLTRTNNPD